MIKLFKGSFKPIKEVKVYRCSIISLPNRNPFELPIKWQVRSTDVMLSWSLKTGSHSHELENIKRALSTIIIHFLACFDRHY